MIKCKKKYLICVLALIYVMCFDSPAQLFSDDNFFEATGRTEFVIEVKGKEKFKGNNGHTKLCEVIPGQSQELNDDEQKVVMFFSEKSNRSVNARGFLSGTNKGQISLSGNSWEFWNGSGWSKISNSMIKNDKLDEFSIPFIDNEFSYLRFSPGRVITSPAIMPGINYWMKLNFYYEYTDF